jgi:hypothetical protein
MVASGVYGESITMNGFVLSGLLGIALSVGVASAADVVVRTAPPPVRVERRPVRPSPRYVWVSGYDRWNGYGYVWVPGRWVLPPRGRTAWVAPRWDHRQRGYVFVAGYWR